MAPVPSQPRTGIDRFMRWTTRNAGLRLLSIALAIALWMLVNTGERGAVVQLTVPISYRSLPAAMVIVNHPPDFVRIDVTGTRRLLSLVDPERMTLKLDLRNLAAGQAEVKLDPSMFNAPRGTSVTQIAPDTIPLDLDRLVSREVAVHLAIDGLPASGYALGKIEVRPPAVTVTGPSRVVLPLAQVNSDSFDISGLSGDAERMVTLNDLGAPVRLSATEVDARVNIIEQIGDREFRSNVDVVDSQYKFRVEPRAARVTIRGPVLKLQGIEAKGLIYVDAKYFGPGMHEVAPQVHLPDGMQVIQQSPAKVRVRTFQDKLVVNGAEHPS